MAHDTPLTVTCWVWLSRGEGSVAVRHRPPRQIPYTGFRVMPTAMQNPAVTHETLENGLERVLTCQAAPRQVKTGLPTATQLVRLGHETP